MPFDPAADYPLGSRRPEAVQTPSGLALGDVTLAALRAGRLEAGDLRATAGTLRLQSQVARTAGRAALAENLARAAELAGIPDETLLDVYTALRPHRSTAGELEDWAQRLAEVLGAPLTAAFVREAAAAYAARGLLRGEPAAQRGDSPPLVRREP